MRRVGSGSARLHLDTAIGNDELLAPVKYAPHHAPVLRARLALAVDDRVSNLRGAEVALSVRAEQRLFRLRHLVAKLITVGVVLLQCARFIRIDGRP